MKKTNANNGNRCASPLKTVFAENSYDFGVNLPNSVPNKIIVF